jgi:hypothetical protein
MAANEDLSNLGARGLIVHYDERYYFVTEAKWHQQVLSSAPANPQVARLKELKAVMAGINDMAYVDLDHLAELPGTTSPPPAQTVAWSDKKPSVVLQENGKYFQVTLDNLTVLTEGFEGDARVLVNRGALVAAIPQNSIPSGTYCVLVNLTGLTQT